MPRGYLGERIVDVAALKVPVETGCSEVDETSAASCGEWRMPPSREDRKPCILVIQPSASPGPSPRLRLLNQWQLPGSRFFGSHVRNVGEGRQDRCQPVHCRNRSDWVTQANGTFIAPIDRERHLRRVVRGAVEVVARVLLLTTFKRYSTRLRARPKSSRMMCCSPTTNIEAS